MLSLTFLEQIIHTYLYYSIFEIEKDILDKFRNEIGEEIVNDSHTKIFYVPHPVDVIYVPTTETIMEAKPHLTAE